MADDENKEGLELALQVVDDFIRADDHREAKREIWEECYKLYRSHREEPQKGPDGKPLKKSNLFIPYTFGIIESEVPKITSSVFAQTPYVSVVGREPGDAANAEVMEALLQYQFERLDIQDIVGSWVKETLMYGTGVVKVSWKTDTRTVKRKVERGLPGVLGMVFPMITFSEVVEEEITEWDDPWIEHIDLWDFYVDPAATTIEDARYVVHRVWRTIDELREMEEKGIYSNIDDVVQALDDIGEMGVNKRRVLVDENGEETDDARNGRVEVLERWTDDRVTVVAARTVVIRNEESPFYHGKKPFVAIVDHDIPHEFWGVGEIEPIRYLQHELNTQRNQRIDNASLSINRMLWVDPSSEEMDRRQLYSEAGHTIEGRYGQDWGFADAPQVNPAAYQEEAITKDDMQWVLQIFDTTRGALPARQETATTTINTQQRSDERFNDKIRRIEYMGIRKLARLMVALNQQFIDNAKVMRITGDEGFEYKEVDPQSIMGTFDLIPRGSNAEPLANRAVRRQQTLEFVKVASQIPQFNQMTNWPALYRQLANEFDMKNVDQLIAPATQIPGSDPAGNPNAVQGGLPPPGMDPMLEAAAGMGGEVSPMDGMQAPNLVAMAQGGVEAS